MNIFFKLKLILKNPFISFNLIFLFENYIRNKFSKIISRILSTRLIRRLSGKNSQSLSSAAFPWDNNLILLNFLNRLRAKTDLVTYLTFVFFKKLISFTQSALQYLIFLIAETINKLPDPFCRKISG